jgi:mannose-P-dolichol utilization defect protein 1
MDSFLAFNITATCIKFTISKALGYAIILGAVGVKLPQVLNIVKAGTVAGLTSSTYICELLSYTIFGIYNLRKGFAFSTYGENMFLAIQNLVLMYCFVVFPARAGEEGLVTNPAKKIMVVVTGLAVYSAVLGGLYVSVSPTDSASLFETALIAAPNVLMLTARLPQIVSNYSNKSTGVLSVITQTLNVLGTLARVFTTTQEVDDFGLLATVLLAFVLNLIILLQIFMYWKNTAKALEAKTK